MCFINEANYTAACLLIISEVIKSRDDIRFSLYRTTSTFSNNKSTKINDIMDDDDEEVFYDKDKLDEQILLE
jgi:hypothetical protein